MALLFPQGYIFICLGTGLIASVVTGLGSVSRVGCSPTGRLMVRSQPPPQVKVSIGKTLKPHITSKMLNEWRIITGIKKTRCNVQRVHKMHAACPYMGSPYDLQESWWPEWSSWYLVCSCFSGERAPVGAKLPVLGVTTLNLCTTGTTLSFAFHIFSLLITFSIIQDSHVSCSWCYHLSKMLYCNCLFWSLS